MTEEENQIELKQENGQEPNSTKKFLSNIIVVIFSNILTAVSGILAGFLIPKILGVTDYGYYKTFALYASYIGLFHFGFVDGIYLKYAGKKYDDIDKRKFASFTHFLFATSAFISAIFVIAGFAFFNQQIGLILLFLGLDILALMITGYYECIARVTMRFKKLSLRSILKCVFTLSSVLTLFIMYKYASVTIYYYYYIIAVLAVEYLLCFWYVFTYREITFKRGASFKEVKTEIWSMYKFGFPLLCSNLIGQFIFVVDQQFVNIYFDIDTYSAFAFAYSMINLITVATSAISTVLYPTLKKMDENKITGEYAKINAVLVVFVSFCLACYFVLVPFVTRFLPDYVPSLATFRIILPGVLISSSISVIKHNCYKRFDKIGNYFVKSLIVFGLAVGADFAAYYLFKTTDALAIVSVFVLLIWYMLSELYFIREYHVHWARNLIYMVCSIALFYGATFIPNPWIGLGAYVLAYLVLTLAIYNKDLIGSIKGFSKK